MTHQGIRRIFRDRNGSFFYSFNYLVLIMGILLLFAGCEDVQQLLAPVPVEDDEGTIKIGFMYTSDTRSNSLNGAELAALQLNGEGGAHGREIEIIARGNISDTGQAAGIAEELILQAGVSAIVGPNRSNYAVVIGPVAQRHGIPMVTTTATNPSVTAAGDFVFMAAFTDDFQGKVMATFATQDLEAKPLRSSRVENLSIRRGYRKPSLITLLLWEARLYTLNFT